MSLKMNLFFVAILGFLLITACKDSATRSFDTLNRRFQQLQSNPGSSYDESIKNISNLKNDLQLYLHNFPNTNKRAKAEQILAEAKEFQIYLQQEQLDFSELEKRFKSNHTLYESDLEINHINNFLQKYPHSIRLNQLKDRRDKLYYYKFQLQTAASPNSIGEANQMIQLAMDAKQQIQNQKLQNLLQNKISQIENHRQILFEAEFQLAAAKLLQQMRQQALEIASQSHPLSKNEYVSENIISGNINTPAYNVTVIREYSIQMRGAILGYNRYQVTVQMKGLLNGTLQTGMTYQVIDALKVSDFKIN